MNYQFLSTKETYNGQPGETLAWSDVVQPYKKNHHA